jgi:hypothetical protein
VGCKISIKIYKICFHALFEGWVACDGSLIFFLMSGDAGDGADYGDGRLFCVSEII